MNRRRLMYVAIAAAALGGAASIAHATAPAKDGRIVFTRYRYREDVFWGELFTANPNGTDERKLTHAPRGYQDEDPDWSPDGAHVVFTRCPPSQEHCAIWSVAVKSGDEVRLSPYVLPGSNPPKYVEDKFPAYSPDGRRVAFVRYSGGHVNGILMVADARLQHARPLLREFGGAPRTPVWSPDGRRIAFSDFNDDGTRLKPLHGLALYVVGAYGGNLRRVTPWGLRAGLAPDWSPDGTRILFRTEPPGSRDAGRGALYTIRPAGTALRRLTHLPSDTRVLQLGSYSPDGNSIAFGTTAAAVVAAGVLPDIFVMSTDGTDIRPVTRIRNWDGSPDWGPS
jgi:Tol biopolymer transport system component